MSKLKKIFDGIQTKFDTGDLGDMSATYLFQFGEEDWALRIEEGKGAVEEGDPGDATCTIQMDTDDFIGLVKSEKNAQMLFMSGKLKVSGNMGQALKLQKVLS